MCFHIFDEWFRRLAEVCNPLHATRLIKHSSREFLNWQAQPGSRLVEESYFCPLCQDRAAGIDFLAVALQVVRFSDEEFFDAELCRGFAENAENASLQGRALWPGGNFDARHLQLVCSVGLLLTTIVLLCPEHNAGKPRCSQPTYFCPGPWSGSCTD